MADAKIVLTAVDQTSAAFSSVQRNMLGLGQQASRLAATLSGIGATGVVLGLARMVKESANAIDAFNDLKDATGASIENISALDRVARLTGVEFNTVSDILIKFNKALSESGDSESQVSEVLRQLGLDAEELKRIDPAQALRLTAQALAQFADDGNKARAVQILYGRSLKDAAPFLKDLAEQGGLVATVTTQQAEEAEKFNKELFKLKSNIGDVSRSMSMDLITAINATIEKFREGAKEGRGFFSVAASIYWGNIRKFYGKEDPAAPSAGGADGGFGDPAAAAEAPSLQVKTKDELAAEKRLQAEREKRAKELAEEAKRLRQQDTAGWVKYVEAVQEEDERLQELLRQQAEERNKEEGRLRKQDLAGWVAYAEARVNEDYEMARQIADQQIEELKKTGDAGKDIGRELGLTFSSAAEDALVNWKDLGEVVRGVGNDIARIIYRKQITEPLAAAVSGFDWSSLFKFNAQGGVYNSPSLSAFSNGVYDSPRMFAFAQGAGIFAEAGPEAIMPLKRMPDGNLGVRAEGGGQGAVVVNQTFHIDARSDQASIMTAIRQGGEAVKAEILRSKARGGVFA